MIKPRAIGMEAMARDGRTPPVAWFGPYPKDGEKLYTLADVLAALRETSDKMLLAGHKVGFEQCSPLQHCYEVFIAMLDQFEKEQNV